MKGVTTTGHLRGEGSAGRELDHVREAPSPLIKVGSRMGVWGLVGGFGVMTAFTLGAPVSLGLAISLMGAGVVTSGLGTLAASIAVLRESDSVPTLIRAGAIAGVPLGGALTILGVTSLSRWAPLISIVNAITPIAAGLGAVVVVLLVLGFFLGFPGDDKLDG